METSFFCAFALSQHHDEERLKAVLSLHHSFAVFLIELKLDSNMNLFLMRAVEAEKRV